MSEQHTTQAAGGTDPAAESTGANQAGQRPAPDRSLDSLYLDSSSLAVDDVLEAMRDVVDPELMVNVVDLGLLYGVQIDDNNNVTLDMTLTTPTCPLTDRIEYDTHAVLEGMAQSVTINWVWLPPWSLEMITEDGREQLRAIGYNV